MKNLIKELISSGYLKTPRLIEAFERADRRDFVSDEHKDEAYINSALPIGHGQTISQPLTVAFMLELLQPEEGNVILEIGSGSGWQTSLLASAVGENGHVFAMELIPELCDFGKKNVLKYSFIKKGIVKIFCRSAVNGLPEEAPFDKVISAASAEEVPKAWKEQLKVGGRMVLPIKDGVHLLVKKSEDNFKEQIFPGFVFVPFVI
jgi:protein-L-isoaspartate(D-aspartate) O-methyltransferase